MADVCVTCLYKDEAPMYINQDQLLVLTKLLEPCNLFQNLKHLLSLNSKICGNCQRKLMDIANFRNTVLMSLDLLNNMQEVLKVETYSHKTNYQTAPQQNEAPTYLTLGNEYMSAPVQQQQQSIPKPQEQMSTSINQKQEAMAELCTVKGVAGDSEMPPASEHAANSNTNTSQSTDRNQVAKFKQESLPKVPYVNILPPPELVGSSQGSVTQEHDYSDAVAAKEAVYEGQITQPLENERQWYIKVLTSDQILAKMEEKRLKPEFASAPYKCKSCVIVFRSEEQLEAHTQGCHTKAAGRFSCYVCSRRFPTLPALNRHVSLHSSRVYVCARCDRDSFDCREIKTHICVKGRVKPKPLEPKPQFKWQCIVCHSMHQSAEELDDHIEKIHRKSELLKCPKCRKTFKFVGKLTSHMKKKHGGHNLMCINCQTEFENEKALKVHVKACLLKNKKG